MSEVIHVQAPSRLHFGLFSRSVGGPGPAPVRGFGGVGLMIQEPGVRLAVRLAEAWSADGPAAERALVFAARAGSNPCHLTIQRCGREHCGLGTGTQLALAVGSGTLLATHGQQPHGEAVARLMGRGRRSAIGIHGFRHGGFLVEGGKAGAAEISPLVSRVTFPSAWRVVLAIPRAITGLHGRAEAEIFGAGTPDADVRQSEALCRLTLLGMLPALVCEDLAAFEAALYEFNRQAGEMFRDVQGGTYADPLIGDIVAFLRRVGVQGVGQSSWGPATFAVVEADKTGFLVRALMDRFGLSAEELLVTQADNHGATFSRKP